MPHDDISNPISKYPIPQTWLEIVNQLPQAPEYQPGGVGGLFTAQLNDLINDYSSSGVADLNAFFTQLSGGTPPRSLVEFQAALKSAVLGGNSFISQLEENIRTRPDLFPPIDADDSLSDFLIELVNRFREEIEDLQIIPLLSHWNTFTTQFNSFMQDVWYPNRLTELDINETFSSETLTTLAADLRVNLSPSQAPISALSDIDFAGLLTILEGRQNELGGATAFAQIRADIEAWTPLIAQAPEEKVIRAANAVKTILDYASAEDVWIPKVGGDDFRLPGPIPDGIVTEDILGPGKFKIITWDMTAETVSWSTVKINVNQALRDAETLLDTEFDEMFFDMAPTSWTLQSWKTLRQYTIDSTEFEFKLNARLLSVYGLVTQMLSSEVGTRTATEIIDDAKSGDSDWAHIIEGLLAGREENMVDPSDPTKTIPDPVARAAAVLSSLSANPLIAIDHFLQTYNGNFDKVDFDEKLGLFMTVTAKIDPDLDFGANGAIPNYQQIFEMFFPHDPNNDDPAVQTFYRDLLTEFYQHNQNTYGYFLPSQNYDQWVERAKQAYLEVHGLDKPVGKRGRDLAIIDRILRLLAEMVGVLQSIAAAQAERLSFYTKWQQAYTTLLSDIPIKGTAEGGAWDASTVQQFGGTMGSLQTKVRAWRDQVGDEAKQMQTALNQSTDAANQQANMGSALLQQLSTILSQIYR